MDKYLIISGYHQSPHHGQEWFHHVWWENLTRFAKPFPQRTFIIADSNSVVPGAKGEWIVLSGNLGNCGHILRGEKPYFMPGCPATWMLGAWLAYINECDLIYREQDVLCFGPWVERMYRELGERKVIAGSGRAHGITTCLFLVKHQYLPQFVYSYLNEGPENHPNRIAEWKFRRLEEKFPEDYCRYSFGYDTDRPFNVRDEAFFLQKITRGEMQGLERAGLLSCEGMPDEVQLFSNQ